MNSLEQRIADLEAHLKSLGQPVDSRLDEQQLVYMKHFVEVQGLDEREAKLRVLCMGTPPDHYKKLPPGTAYPRMLYMKGGKTCRVEDAEEHAKKKKAGWLDTPLQEHLDKFQKHGGVTADERISKLQKELDREIAAKAREVAA